jgi:dTDP-4-amino-4,6-dideoxygalactose transaminase
MQSTIGRCQLKKIDKWLLQRAANASTLASGLNDIDGIHIPTPQNHIAHAYYRFTVIFKDGDRRDRVVQHLNSVGVPAAVGPCPEIYREKAFKQLGFVPQEILPIAADLGKRGMVLPVFPGMESALGFIIDHIATSCA